MDGWSLFSLAEQSDESAIPSTSATPHVPGRRRRLLNRLSRADSDLRASTNASGAARGAPSFNPAASEFVPRMPPKRKASSSARSSKSATPRNHAPFHTPNEHPVISSEDVFGRDALAISPTRSEPFDSLLDDEEMHSDLFEIELQELRHQNQALSPRTERIQAPGLYTCVQYEKSKRPADAVQCHSAILFCQERPVSETTEDLTRLKYLPLVPVTPSTRRDAITKDTNLTIHRHHRERIDAATRGSGRDVYSCTWPQNALPVEIFDLVTNHLSRDDVKSMRLVNKEFESKVSATLFYSAVVPFNTELYDMIDEDSKTASRKPPTRNKGKGRARDSADLGANGRAVSLHWQNAKEDADGKVYKGHGLRVFQGFGPHIRKFGMSFEVAESQLSRPPIKKELDHVDSYHGSYDWPPQQYARFANLAGLERTADETLRMKSAFSNLQKVQDVALSIDNGLGWLNGPDRSYFSRIFQRPTPVFGQSRAVQDHQMQESNTFWAAIQSCHHGLAVQQNQKEMCLAHRSLNKAPSDLKGLQGTRYADVNLWSAITAGRVAPSVSTTDSPEDMHHGVFYTTGNHPDFNNSTLYDKTGLVPAELRKEQKEWLMETDWAQRAFLECYILAVIDNPATFSKVKTLTIAKISSGLLPILARESFWDGLPAITDVTLHVKPDWRTVEKDNAGFAEACAKNPSEAVNAFYRSILRDRICLRASITKLNIGWIGGGEDADGIFARNNHILPAPIAQLEHSTAANANFGLVFKFVEHLTLTNCWITPPALEELVRTHAGKSLKVLTLDSVSLTAHPRFPVGGQAALQQHIAQAANGIHLAPALNGNPIIPAANGNPNHGFLANMQQWLNTHNPNNHNNGGHPIQGFGAAHLQNMLQQQYAQQLGLAVPPNMANAQGLPAQPLTLGGHVPQVVQQQQAAPNPPNVLQQHQMLHSTTSATANSHWTAGHREGSWPDVLDKISPGPIFTDYLAQPAPWEEQLPERTPSTLQKIELNSCGYAKLTNNNWFDQFAIEVGHDYQLSVWFRTRQTALSSAMMSHNDRYIARIIQHMPQKELDALQFAWGLLHGWSDRTKAEEAEFDGLLAGGTGRFSGTIDRDMPVRSTRAR